MPISVRFLSGSLEGREFEIAKDAIRIGDSDDADIRIDPDAKDNGGARDRIIEIYRDGNVYRVHSTGNREISAQGDTAVDRKVAAGEEIRFGAWGPIFEIVVPGGRTQSTAPIPIVSPGDDSAARRRKGETADFRTPSGEKPVGPKTVYMMIQDALEKAKGSEGGALEKGTTFIREVVTDSIRNATRSFKIGLALMGAAILILAAILVFNIATTKETLTEVSRAADKRVADVKQELSGELVTLKKGRDDLAKESEELTKRLTDVEKSSEADQKTVAALKARLKDAEERRRDLEARMTKALAAMEADRARLAAERERLERERQMEAERRRAEEAARLEAERARAALAPPPAEPAATVPAATPPPQ